jgi:hypothetical protein
MAIELRQITNAGTYGEIFPDWSDLTFSQDLLEPGTLTFDYPIDGANSELLQHGAILAVLIDGVEPINGRFVYDEGKGSRVASSDDPISSYGCSGVLNLGSKMSLAPAIGSTVFTEDLFQFLDKTPGYLVNQVLLNTYSRANVLASMPSWITYPTTAFTDVNDSSGAAWPQTIDVTYQSGDSLLDVLTWLTTNGFAEPYMDKRDLKLFNPTNNGTNLSLGSNPTVFATGRDFEEATYQTTSKELINSLFVVGDNNACAWVQDAASAAQYGYREGKMTVSNATEQATLIAAGTAFLNLHKIPRWSYTYSVPALYLDETNEYHPSHRPFVDFRVGDSVLIMDGLSSSVQRIRLMSATWPSSRSSTVNLSVNDLFGERDVELERRLSRLGI